MFAKAYKLMAALKDCQCRVQMSCSLFFTFDSHTDDRTVRVQITCLGILSECQVKFMMV